MKHRPVIALAACLGLLATPCGAEEAGVTIHADRVLFRLSDLMIGANMEDLHYQMVGGFDSQMLHGESFFEHSPTELAPLKGQLEGFANVNGEWTATNGAVSVALRHGGGTPWLESGLEGGQPPVAPTNTLAKDAGTRLTSLAPAPADVVETRAAFHFETNGSRTASLIAHVHPNHSDSGWNWYTGYTVELDAQSGCVRLLAAQRAAKHTELAKCAVELPRGAWVPVALRVTGTQLVVHVGGRDVLTQAVERALPSGQFGVVALGALGVRELALVSASGNVTTVPLRPNPLLAQPGDALSFRWTRVQSGSAEGAFAFDQNGWHKGLRSQQIMFKRGAGEFGCENAGLAGRGLTLRAGKNYEGFLRVKTSAPTPVVVSLRGDDGKTILAEQTLTTQPGETFQCLEFSLTPVSNAWKGRFAITLRKPGSASLGYAFLQPGEWGRFKGLPVRKDLAEALLAQGIRVLRFNGGMIEVPGYRWKNLRGPRDQRPPYNGFYDRYCSSGFGPAEAVAFGKAAGIPVIPALNLDESPEEVADFVATCQPQFYQVANENRFDAKYVAKFKLVAEAVWKVAPDITLVTTSTGGRGNDLHLELAGFARARGKRIMFDCHSFEGAAAVEGIAAFARWLKEKAPEMSVGILEFNAGAFDFQRGLNHALEMNATHRHGDVIRAVGTPNVSQPWGIYQSDWKAVLWTQGNIYYTGEQVWFQTAYYVDQLIARSWAPDAVAMETAGTPAQLDVFAAKSADGTRLVVRVVNLTATEQPLRLAVRGVAPGKVPACVTTLAHTDLADFNTASEPERIKPVTSAWRPDEKRGVKIFPPHSFTVIELPIETQPAKP